MTRMNVIVFGALLMLSVVTATPVYPSNPSMLIDTIVPFQEWTPHGPEVTGLVFTSPTSSDNLGIDWIRTMTKHGNYWFSVDGDSPQVLYWPSEGEGKNYLRNWNMPTATGGTRQYNASMYAPTTPNSHGLNEEVHVVTLEVNDGYGSTDGVHFVATKTSVLWTPTKQLLKMRNKFKNWVKRKSQKSTQMMQYMEKKIVSENPGGTVGTVTEKVGEYPTYKDGCLVVIFYRHVYNIVRFPEEVEEFYCPPGAPCAYPPSKQRVITFGVEEYMTFEKCKGSKLKKTATDRAKYIGEATQEVGW